MIVAAAVVALLLLIVVISPFFSKDNSVLSHGSSINDPGILKSLKDNLVKRYIEEDAAHKLGNLSDLAWEKRKQFLVNRYVDAARRLDFLEKLSEASHRETGK